MRKFNRRQRHILSFGLFLALAVALLLPAALAPRANAGSTDYWIFEEPQGVLINQPLASNYNLTLASSFASGGQPGGFQPDAPDANASWTGAVSNVWSLAGNWTAGGPPTGAQIATFDANFTGANQPQINAATAVGELHMATGVTQNVTISATAANILTINGVGGTGILIDNANAFTLTITARISIGDTQTWTNNSGNLFTVSGATAAFAGNNDVLTVNGTGNTLISADITGGMGQSLVKDGTGTLTLSGNNTYPGGTTVNGGTLLVNNTAGSGTGGGAVAVNNAGSALGGTGIISGAVTVSAGANIAPGNGGNTTGILQTGALTMASTSNFKVDINGTTAGSGYDRVQVNAGGVTLTGSNLMVTVGTTLSVGQTFTILDKVSGGAITGTFAGIPQGGTVVGSDGTVFTVSYVGGNGNDVVLTVQALVPEPGTYIGGTLAIAGLAFTQRRRLRKLIARRCAVAS